MEQLPTGVISKLLSIDDIIRGKHQYNIPRYQRLYVWKDTQVITLLEEFQEACKNNKSLFYLGGILVVRQRFSNETYDLIDGQQRFTTLWLLSHELGNSLKDFTRIDDKPRLRFAIREQVTDYFHGVLKADQDMNININEEESSLQRIINARNIIRGFIQEQLKDDVRIEQLVIFIREKVKLVVSEVPQDTDLNKLFEVINNRGLQLQHQDILKSRLMSLIPTKEERIRYEKIWNACSGMEDYIENTLKELIGRSIGDAYNIDTKEIDVDSILARWQENEDDNNGSLKLSVILAEEEAIFMNSQQKILQTEDDPLGRTDDELEKVRSILTFPQLLLHTLRIFLYNKREKDIPRIDEKELLFIFREHAGINNEGQAKGFLRLLWNVRVAFDVHIIKWVTKENSEVHQVKSLEKYFSNNGWYLRRRTPENDDGFSLLQSMLYHSQQSITQYWITPLLYKCLETSDTGKLYTYLRKLDNTLFCTGNESILSERTWNIIGKDLDSRTLDYNINALNAKSGVHFLHYWFYKLDFVLWYLLKDQKGKSWKEYRMTAKNSVEHISPQQPRQEDESKVTPENLDDFGNLVLVSRSINSTYGNNPYKVKQTTFLLKPIPDSLKSVLIFEHPTWNDDLCLKHRDYMKSLLVQYFERN